MKTNIQSLIKTTIILLVYTLIWQILEFIIDGYIVERTVDTIMIFLFAPFIYYTVNVITKKRQIYYNHNNSNLPTIENIHQFDGIILVDGFEGGYRTYSIIAVKMEKLKLTRTMLVAKYYDIDTAKAVFNKINQEYYT